MQMQVGDIIVVNGKTFMAKLVEKFTGSKWSHTALYIGAGYILETDFNKKAAVIKNPYFTSGEGYTVLRSRAYVTATQKKRIFKTAFKYDRKGNTYDYKLIVGLALKKLFPKLPFIHFLNDKNMFICTELVNQVMHESGIDLDLNPAGDIYPEDFMHTKQLVVVGEYSQEKVS